VRAAPVILLSACAAIVLAGCSDDERPVRTVKVRPDSTVQMGADEYHFDPGRIIVRARGKGTRLGIVLHNRGDLAHNIHVRDGALELAATRSFKPGGRKAVKLNLAPGTYDFVCTVADHDELGMTGKIEVR
jgi:plastocyanin